MGNLWLNWRVFSWHLQIGDPGRWSVRVRYNARHKEHNWCDGYFSWSFDKELLLGSTVPLRQRLCRHRFPLLQVLGRGMGPVRYIKCMKCGRVRDFELNKWED